MQIETSNYVLTGGFDISNDDSILNESASTNQLPDINAGIMKTMSEIFSNFVQYMRLFQLLLYSFNFITINVRPML